MIATKTSIQGKIAQLKGYQQTFIDEILNNLLLVNSIDINESLKPTVCYHCDSNMIVKHGGNRVRCKACGSTQIERSLK